LWNSDDAALNKRVITDMKCKECGRNRSWRNLRFYTSNYLEGLRETTKTQSEYAVSGPRFEPGPYRIQSRSVNHSTSMYENRNTVVNLSPYLGLRTVWIIWELVNQFLCISTQKMKAVPQ
jgi:hypothetical protein